MIYLIFRPFSNIDEDLEDIEYDHPDLTSRSHLDIGDLKDEVLSVYHQVIDLPWPPFYIWPQGGGRFCISSGTWPAWLTWPANGGGHIHV